MWNEYFPNAIIYGIENNPRIKFDGSKIKTILCDQTNRHFLDNYFTENKIEADIIIDDGGHKMTEQQISFSTLWKYVKSGGFYVIEDLHTSQSGYKIKNGSFIDYIPTTLDVIQNENLKSLHIPNLESIQSQIDSIYIYKGNKAGSIYNSITCVIKKK